MKKAISLCADCLFKFWQKKCTEFCLYNMTARASEVMCQLKERNNESADKLLGDERPERVNKNSCYQMQTIKYL